VSEYDSREGKGFDRSVLTFGIGFDPLPILVTSPACRSSAISYLPRIDIIIIQGPILPQRPRHLQARGCGRNPNWRQATGEQVAAIRVILTSAVASICNARRSLQNPRQQRNSGIRTNHSVYASGNKNNCFINGTRNCETSNFFNGEIERGIAHNCTFHNLVERHPISSTEKLNPQWFQVIGCSMRSGKMHPK
jgi:hypothetical protein